MGRYEVRNEVLLLARLLRVAVEQVLEAVVGGNPGFIIFDNGPSASASGAIFRYRRCGVGRAPSRYSGDSIARS